MAFSQLDSIALRNAAQRGDNDALERYMREYGGSPVQTLTTATGSLIPGTNLINKATGGFNYTLPNSVGSQAVVTAVIQTAITSGTTIIRTARVLDFMVGMMTFGTTTFAAGSTEAIGGTDALITLTAAAGGVKGAVMVFTDIAPNLWLVNGQMSSTTSATVVGVWA